VKTGRLLKFHRPGGDVHVYLYLEGERARAAIYTLGQADEHAPLHQILGRTAEEVEAEARAWIDLHYPRPS
jgi:hypothetical protein